MAEPLWQKMLLRSPTEDGLWELFHENSKIGKYQCGLPDDYIIQRMKTLRGSLDFEGHPRIELPSDREPLTTPLENVITSRVSDRNMKPCSLSLRILATLLHYAYGITRDNKDTGYPRPFRIVPSAGGLYPLELVFYSAHIEGLSPGLYHYNPSQSQLRLIRKNDLTKPISQAMVHPELGMNASILIFITAVFERSMFKYGERGYRFILLEAGHVAQNINLVATALGLASVNIGGFFDRDIDELLGLDGVTHSTLYIVSVGHRTIRNYQPHKEV